jgi:hypothetical protein
MNDSKGLKLWSCIMVAKNKLLKTQAFHYSASISSIFTYRQMSNEIVSMNSLEIHHLNMTLKFDATIILLA